MEHIDIEEMMRSIYEVFVRFDKDGSETLELKELMSFMKACRIPVAPDECKIIIEQMDINNDGVLDFGEFLSLLGMIFKIRFSKQTMMKEEFQTRKQRSTCPNPTAITSKAPPSPRRNNTTRY